MGNIHTPFKIGYWNIKKLISKQTDKSKDELFINSINRRDIIGLAEVKSDINKVQFDNLLLIMLNGSLKRVIKAMMDYAFL